MKVSVIVPTHKGRDLTKLINSYKANSYKKKELIIVDEGLERSKQRNIGIERATGQAYLFLDSDQSMSDGLIFDCVRYLQCGVTAVYIPEQITDTSFFGRVRNFERQFLNGTHVDVPRFVAAHVCPKFDEDLSGPEDADWAQRIPGRRATSTEVMYHDDYITFKDYCAKKAYYTKSMKRYIEKWPNDPCVNVKYRCFDIFVEKGKWVRLISHPILTISMFFMLAVRGIIFYGQR